MELDPRTLDAATARCCELSLIDFVEEMWPAIESQPFVRNWHHEVICDHLQAVSRGELENVLINIPPGCTKSLLVAVMWPCWEWVSDASVRWFFASYHQHLASRDSTKSRALVNSAKYQRFWGDRYHWVGDQNQKTYFENSAGGYRLATSIGGHATGEHMDRIVVDDPHDVESAESDKQRQRVIEWWDQTMSTRGVARGVRRVVVMQRLHEKDLSGHIMGSSEADEWVHVCLPMRYEKERHFVSRLGHEDPRRDRKQKLMFPELFSEPTVKVLERKLGIYGTAGQLQQRPAPLGGGIFKKHWFEIVQVAPSDARRVRYWDKASTEAGGAYTSGLMMAEKRGLYYIEGVERAQLDPFTRNRLIKQTAMIDAAKHGGRVMIVLEGEPGAGGKESSLISVRELAGYPVMIDKVQLGKLERAMAFAGQCGAGNVKIVSRDPNAQWVRDLLEEFEQFPNGEYKDQVDTATGAFNKLALGVGAMGGDLFGDEGELTEEEEKDMPQFLRELIDGVEKRHADEVEYGRAGYDPRELAE